MIELTFTHRCSMKVTNERVSNNHAHSTTQQITEQ